MFSKGVTRRSVCVCCEHSSHSAVPRSMLCGIEGIVGVLYQQFRCFSLIRDIGDSSFHSFPFSPIFQLFLSVVCGDLIVMMGNCMTTRAFALQQESVGYGWHPNIINIHAQFNDTTDFEKL